jgi:CRP-like cAMP-binding protein
VNPARAPTRTERNRLLLALPRADYRPLLRDLDPVTLEHGTVLIEAREPITHIYFPQRCIVSMLTAAGDGPSVEVGLVGNEGMVGLPAFLGATTATTQAVLQVPDRAHDRVGAADSLSHKTSSGRCLALRAPRSRSLLASCRDSD